MLQGYYEHPNRIIRKTEAVELEIEKDIDKAFLLLRWMMSEPVGETLFPPIIEESNTALSKEES